MSELFSPGRLGPLTLRNRIIKSATFEGMARDGLVTDALIDFHVAVAEGGAAMTTLAYLAVASDGRGAPNEIVVDERSAPGLARLAEAVHARGAVVSAQLGHAGPVAASTGKRGLGPSRLLVPAPVPMLKAATDADIARITDDFARSAALLAAAGYDAIELHLGHNYLLSAFLSPALNRRSDQWGGSVEGRAAFALQVVQRVREEVGPEVALLAKVNMRDGHSAKGISLADSLATVRLLEQQGHLDAVVLTAGSSLRDPMYLLRGPVPIKEFAAAVPASMSAAIRVGGKVLLKDYAFEEAFLRADARRFLAALSVPLVLLGGINEYATAQSAIAEGFAFVAMARALLADPGLPARWQSGDQSTGPCTHCNLCLPTIYSGTCCVLTQPGERPGSRLRSGGE